MKLDFPLLTKAKKDTLFFNDKNYSKLNYLNRYYIHYNKNVCFDLIYKQNLKNLFEIPKIKKIILNLTYKTIINEKKHIVPGLISLELISGQKLKWTNAKKSIAGFKLRKSQIIGCKVDLRSMHMYSFLEKLITIILPRVRNFAGISENVLNQKNHLSIGLPEILVFPELENYFEFLELLKGIDITIVTHVKKPLNYNVHNSSTSTALVFLSAFQFPIK
jgi:large subunit ribosomal protein L5